MSFFSHERPRLLPLLQLLSSREPRLCSPVVLSDFAMFLFPVIPAAAILDSHRFLTEALTS